jgi:hypothetical protein
MRSTSEPSFASSWPYSANNWSVLKRNWVRKGWLLHCWRHGCACIWLAVLALTTKCNCVSMQNMSNMHTMMNMTYFTCLPFFTYYTYVPSKNIFHIFTILCIFMAVFRVKTTVWCRLLLTWLAFSNTFEGTKNYLRKSALWT